MKVTKGDVFYYPAMLLAIWFALSAGAWSYAANLIISFPFGVLSVILWAIGRNVDVNKPRYKRIPIIWAVGVLISTLTLLYFILFD